ncbi:Protein kinase-like domain [Pseudocohnilembus persalinus]|uniref:Protein kinase-like domain n=1 Tax=Pseudocohnilembus persalinus TaxID=266149 RepID=A0A0V0R3S1_PSEPJ|nr:Protein kinase-like domain [Pseudocohnilembus persalinus]|eukprot:KRX08856.1 Protein kinase-like domain [Pseudocohnilembus persalinus]
MAELIQNQQNNQFENESQIDLAITSENLKNKDENQNFYALKIIDKKKPQYKHRAQKEIEILNKLNNANKDQNDSPYNIVKIFDHFEFENYLIIVQELMETSLSDLLICLQFQGFNFFQIAKWTKQLLKAIQFLQNQNIIHADIKPSNILFKNDNAYLSDFGSAFYISQQENIYPYFQSRFYRAPEVILEINQFKQIDLWSLACVTAEMYLGFPLFHGKNTHDQIIKIVTILKCTVWQALEDPFINYFNNVDKITYETKQTNDQIEN